MKIVAFSDVHGNQYAFDAFLEQIKKIEYDYIFFCGDIHGYYYGQSSIITKMKQMKNLFAVRGNHDKMAIDVFDGKHDGVSYFEKYGHSYAMLETENIRYVKNLPQLIELELGAKKYAILHGTLEDKLEGRLYPNDQVKNENSYQKYDIVFCGHTHYQMIKKCGNSIIINAGSVGQQRDGKGFCFVYFDTETMQTEYRQIVYEKKSLEFEIIKNDPENRKLIEILYRNVQN